MDLVLVMSGFPCLFKDFSIDIHFQSILSGLPQPGGINLFQTMGIKGMAPANAPFSTVGGPPVHVV